MLTGTGEIDKAGECGGPIQSRTRRTESVLEAVWRGGRPLCASSCYYVYMRETVISVSVMTGRMTADD